MTSPLGRSRYGFRVIVCVSVLGVLWFGLFFEGEQQRPVAASRKQPQGKRKKQPQGKRNSVQRPVAATREQSQGDVLLRRPVHAISKIAVVLQIHNERLWKPLFDCAENVGLAAKDTNKTMDVYIAHHKLDNALSHLFADLHGARRVLVSEVDNFGADVGTYLQQMQQMEPRLDEYDVVLKMHSKTDNAWRERAIESLCGTPEHVKSIFNNFEMLGETQMIVPLGCVITPKTLSSQIFPHIIQLYGGDIASKVFSSDDLRHMDRWYTELFGDLEDEHYRLKPVLNAGTMFWAHKVVVKDHLRIAKLASKHNWIGFTRGYKDNGAEEHIIERLFASLVVSRNYGLIKEMTPAPKVIGIYFPQYHQSDQNDEFWGKGFTEWTLLKPYKPHLKNILKPLAVEDGGLGYYDLIADGGVTRKKQMQLADEFGIYGFMFYHYWFVGKKAPDEHKVLYKVTEAMARDGKQKKFMLSWANEPWSRKWSGSGAADDTLLLSQELGNKRDWEDHFAYLIQFFQHKQYMKTIDGKPIFVIYRMGLNGAKDMLNMINHFQTLAKQNGFPGLHIVNTIGSFRNDGTEDIVKAGAVSGSFQFLPRLYKERNQMGLIPSFGSLQYWGENTGFDAQVRRNDQPYIHIVKTPNEFSADLRRDFKRMSEMPGREIDQNFYFIMAWNEWNEQAALEPSGRFQFGYLDAVKANLEAVPASACHDRACSPDDFLP